MLYKIKLNVTNLRKRYLFEHMNAYFLRTNNVIFIIDYTWKKYSNAFILQKTLYRTTERVIRMSFKG